jgi:hypothetical protein
MVEPLTMPTRLRVHVPGAPVAPLIVEVAPAV